MPKLPYKATAPGAAGGGKKASPKTPPPKPSYGPPGGLAGFGGGKRGGAGEGGYTPPARRGKPAVTGTANAMTRGKGKKTGLATRGGRE